MARNGPPVPDQRPVLQKRVEKFVYRYIDSPAKAELLRILCYRPTRFQTLPEILALSRSPAVDIERAVFSLRALGFVQLKSSPQGTAIALSPDSPARKLAPALWSHLKNLAEADSAGLPRTNQDSHSSQPSGTRGSYQARASVARDS